RAGLDHRHFDLPIAGGPVTDPGRNAYSGYDGCTDERHHHDLEVGHPVRCQHGGIVHQTLPISGLVALFVAAKPEKVRFAALSPAQRLYHPSETPKRSKSRKVPWVRGGFIDLRWRARKKRA